MFYVNHWGQFDYTQYAEEHQDAQTQYTDADEYGYEEHEQYI